MADLSKIKGDSNPPEPEKARKKSRDVEEIREKWSKVGKVDPEQKKKHKHKAQKEAETNLKQTSEAKPNLGAERKEPSPYEPKPRVGETPPPSAPPPEQGPQAEPPEAPPTSSTPQTQEPQAAPPQPGHKKKKKAEHRPTEPPPPTTPDLAKKGEKTGKKKVAKAVPQAMPPPPEPLPKGAWEATKEPDQKEKEKKEKEEPIRPPPPSTTTTPSGIPAGQTGGVAETAPTPPPLASPFAHLSPQVQQLFDRMVGVMTVMHTTGAVETTIQLDNPKFEKSVFYGSQIVISEFSTAPKAFNIELRGSSAATKLFAENSDDLVAAFAAGGYNFKVNRIDTSYLPPVGEAKRKQARQVKRKKT